VAAAPRDFSGHVAHGHRVDILAARVVSLAVQCRPAAAGHQEPGRAGGPVRGRREDPRRDCADRVGPGGAVGDQEEQLPAGHVLQGRRGAPVLPLLPLLCAAVLPADVRRQSDLRLRVHHLPAEPQPGQLAGADLGVVRADVEVPVLLRDLLGHRPAGPADRLHDQRRGHVAVHGGARREQQLPGGQLRGVDHVGHLRLPAQLLLPVRVPRGATFCTAPRWRPYGCASP
jgi:hypothetical protein